MKENIFSDLYNKLMSFFAQEEVSQQTKNSAKSRLKTVLAQDRVGFSERAIQMLKDEMLLCISKYMEIDEESFDLQISPKDNATVLELSIPVIRPKTDEEIDEAIEAENEKARQKAQEIVDELKGIVEEHAEELVSEAEEKDSVEDDESEENKDDSEGDSKEEDNKKEESDKEKNEDSKNDDEEEEIDEIKENPFEEPAKK